MFCWPTNGKILIIDDKIEEAMPLINLFSKLGISFRYYNGDADLLPDQKCEGLVIIFADIVLIDGTSSKDKTARIAAVISELIEAHTPYVLLPWSKHTGLTTQLITDLQELDVKPICTIALDKWEYFESNEGKIVFKEDKSIEDLDAEILTKLTGENLSMVPFLFSWGNTINECSDKIMCLLNGLEKGYEEEWNNYYFNLLMNFSKSVQGKRFNSEDIIENLKNGVLVMNSLFIDYLHTMNNSKEYPIEFPKDDIKVIPNKSKSLINTRLLTQNLESPKLSPGALFKIENNEIKKKYFFEHFDKSKLIKLFKKCPKTVAFITEKNIKQADITNLLDGKKNEDLFGLYQDFLNDLSSNEVDLLVLEITPSCDYAQKKVVFNRFLMGLKLKNSLLNYKATNDVTYVTPYLEINKEISTILFDAKYFYSPIDGLEATATYIFHFETALLLDVQSQVTKHMNRLGIINL